MARVFAGCAHIPENMAFADDIGPAIPGSLHRGPVSIFPDETRTWLALLELQQMTPSMEVLATTP